MTEPDSPQKPTQTSAQRRNLGLFILGVGILLAILVVAIVPAFHNPWAYLFLLLPVPNLVKGTYEIVAAARDRQ